MMIDSLESEKFRKYIDNKKKYLPTAKKEYAYQLQKDIMLLENEILPIVLNNSVIVYHESTKYFNRCFDESLRNRYNGLLLYLPLFSDYKETPIIGVANPRQNMPPLNYQKGDVQIYCNDVTIFNMDGSGVDNVSCFQIPVLL